MNSLVPRSVLSLAILIFISIGYVGATDKLQKDDHVFEQVSNEEKWKFEYDPSLQDEVDDEQSKNFISDVPLKGNDVNKIEKFEGCASDSNSGQTLENCRPTTKISTTKNYDPATRVSEITMADDFATIIPKQIEDHARVIDALHVGKSTSLPEGSARKQSEGSLVPSETDSVEMRVDILHLREVDEFKKLNDNLDSSIPDEEHIQDDKDTETINKNDKDDWLTHNAEPIVTLLVIVPVCTILILVLCNLHNIADGWRYLRRRFFTREAEHNQGNGSGIDPPFPMKPVREVHTL